VLGRLAGHENLLIVEGTAAGALDGTRGGLWGPDLQREIEASGTRARVIRSLFGLLIYFCRSINRSHPLAEPGIGIAGPNRRPGSQPRFKEHRMKKLRIEELVVDSFTTSKQAEQRGTVAGHQEWTDAHTCGNWCSIYCEDTTGGGGGTGHGITCDRSCVLGATDCGTCAPAYTCDPAEGTQCWGDTMDYRPC
jgi:hypothetical protein